MKEDEPMTREQIIAHVKKAAPTRVFADVERQRIVLVDRDTAVAAAFRAAAARA